MHKNNKRNSKTTDDGRKPINLKLNGPSQTAITQYQYHIYTTMFRPQSVQPHFHLGSSVTHLLTAPFTTDYSNSTLKTTQ